MNDEAYDLDHLIGLFAEEETKSFPAKLVYALSDLSKDDLKIFQNRWDILSVEKKQQLFKRIAESSETNFELDFTSLALFGLTDELAEVRKSAIDALWHQEDQVTMQAIIICLKDDDDDEVRAKAAGSLGRFLLAIELGELPSDYFELVMTSLFNAYETSTTTSDIRRRTLESLSYIHSEQVYALIDETFLSENIRVKASAIFAMGRSGNKRWIPDIYEMLDIPEPELRFEAVRAIGEIRLPDAVERIIELLEDDDPEIKGEAIWALGEIGGLEAKDALVALSQQEGNEDLLEQLEDAIDTASLAMGEFTSKFILLDDDRD